MASRVTRGMAVVAAVSALVLAGAAAGTAWLLWETDQRQQLRDEAELLVSAVNREAREERLTLAGAAPEALRESSVPGARVEVWAPAGLVASAGSGPVIGREGSAATDAAADWIVHRRRMVFPKASPAEVVAGQSAAGLHVLGIPRVDLALVSWRLSNAKAKPEILRWNLPYEIVVVALYPDDSCAGNQQ